MAVSRTSLTFLDKISKEANLSVWATLLTSGNFTAQMGLADDFVDAVQLFSLLNLKKDIRVATETKFSVSAPTDDGAFRGIRGLVSATDANGNAVTFHIPGFDTSKLASGSNAVDLSTGDGATLKAAIEAYAKSNDGEAITVQSVTFVDK